MSPLKAKIFIITILLSLFFIPGEALSYRRNATRSMADNFNLFVLRPDSIQPDSLGADTVSPPYLIPLGLFELDEEAETYQERDTTETTVPPATFSPEDSSLELTPPTIIAPDSLANDTLRSDSVVVESRKEALDAPVIYEATDSIVFTGDGYAHLYGQGKVNYENVELEADLISMNLDSSTVFARGVVDSLGVLSGKPVFKDSDTPYESVTMRYNFKTKKGFINNVVTQQGEGYVVSQDAKKDEDDNVYIQGGRYTTCDHHDHPHFYLHLTRAKMKPKKNVVSGPAYLVIEDVPLPFALPFFFFPFSSSYQSGFIMPTYVDEMNRGFGLTQGGYYFAISDMMDLKLVGEIFTKGSWALGGESTYNRRYKYSGNFQLNYQVTKLGDKGLPDYSISKDFKLVWSHRQDAKASPNSTFSASVNFSTSSYEKTNYGNLYNPQANSQNTKASSVSYSRSFPDQKLTLSGSSNISQTMRDSTVSVTLPDLNISLSMIYPFKKKNRVGEEKWYEKISMSYSGRFSNKITTKDDQLFKSNLIRDWSNGMTHNIPISASFTLFKYINVTPSVTYKETWRTSKTERAWDEIENREVKDTIYGFYRPHDYNMSVQMNTKLYGMYKPIFAKSKEIQIRHLFSPSVSFTVAPDFTKKYNKSYSYLDTSNELKTVTYNPYNEGAFTYSPAAKQGTFSFDVSNNVEMKMKSDRDTTGYRKISLIDELGASITYNTVAERKQWGNLNMRLRLKLTKSYTFSTNAVFATYAYTYDKTTGQVVEGDRTEWSYGRFGRFQGMNQGFSYTFNNDTWKKWFGPKDKDGNPTPVDDEPMLEEGLHFDESGEEVPGTTNRTKKRAEAGADGYQEFKMPWSFSISYSANLREDKTKPINEKSMRYPFSISHSLNGSGNVKLSNKWAVNFNTGYDFQAKAITQTTFSISRDLHCWNMSASLSPFGYYRSYSFCIRANSSMLSDLKWDKRGSAASNYNIQWY